MSAPTMNQPIPIPAPTAAEPAKSPPSNELNTSPTKAELASAGAMPNQPAVTASADAVNLPSSMEHNITPTQAGLTSATVGLGAGLIVGELLVPGAILAVIGLVGIPVSRGASRLFKGASRWFHRT